MARVIYHPDPPRPLRLSLCLFLVLAVLAMGTAGYRWIEQWPLDQCLYMTVITVSTVGFKEVAELSPEGRLFTIALIIFGVGAMAFSVSAIFEYLILRGLTSVFGRTKMDKQIGLLKHHIILCGYGRMGYYIARDLAALRKPFVVIEKDPERIRLLVEEKQLFLEGDAADEDVLREAGIENAAALVATLGSDADNLFLTLSAHGLMPDLQIIVRAEDPDSTRKFRQAGASQVVSPFSTGAGRIVQLLTRPAVVDLIELATRTENLALEVC